MKISLLITYKRPQQLPCSDPIKMRISFINIIIIIINNKYVKTKTNIIILYEIIFHFQNSINVHHVKGMEYNDNDKG